MARLHRRIYLHFVSVLLVVGVAAALVFAFGARDAFRRMMAERMTRHVAALAAERMTDRAALAARLAEIHEHLGIDITVRDRHGDVAAAVGDPLPRRTPFGPGGPDADRHGRWGAMTATPVMDPKSGAELGTVWTAPPAPMALRPIGMPPLWRPVIVLVLVLLVVAIATRPLARRIARPLERLTDAARRLGGGDLSARAPEERASSRADEITELTRAFNEMAEHVERLVRGEKELLANVSHELRSPLTRIRFALELLPHDADTARRLGDVERDLNDLERLIDDVLTTSRLDLTGLPTHLGTIDVRAALTDVAERARHDPVTLASEVVVEAGPPLRITADEALIRRALWNLVENAAKYGRPPITLGADRQGDEVELSVADMGTGIDAADRDRVFAAFYRGAAARTKDSEHDDRRGVGLGLNAGAPRG